MKKAWLLLFLFLFFCPFLVRAAAPLDSDNDGYPDTMEINNGYNPFSSSTVKLPKRIEVELKTQKLRYYLGDIKLGEFKISSGKASTPTPKGDFTVQNKKVRPKSSLYKNLWMPYWVGLNISGYGIHELPEWGKNIKEGAAHLGTPVSHGCVRLGVGPAKQIYDFASVGTKVKIY
ncbi:MAG: L,D-transpeptidase [Candidatus Falkowbacteria bacterium]